MLSLTEWTGSRKKKTKRRRNSLHDLSQCDDLNNLQHLRLNVELLPLPV
jgi:hypothetical protein